MLGLNHGFLSQENRDRRSSGDHLWERRIGFRSLDRGPRALSAREAGSASPSGGCASPNPPLRKFRFVVFFSEACGRVLGLKNCQRLGPIRRFSIRLATCNNKELLKGELLERMVGGWREDGGRTVEARLEGG